MARARNKYSDYLQYLGLRLFGMFAHMFEVSKSYRTARWMGELMWRIDRRHRRVACGHLRLSFPHWPEARVRRVARKSFHNLLYLGVEVLFMPRLIKPNRWRRHVRFRNMGQMLRLMLRQESGLILVTGHFGNFLVVEYTMAAVGIPTVSVARPLDNPYVWNHMMKLLEGNSQR
ncbi:MAG: hypothetical protein AMJ81_05600, partial [Phycisphaerae bacterium SM23_33]